MKKFTLFVLILSFLFMLPTMVAFAQSPTPPDLPTLLQAALALFVGLIGWPAALASVLALLMRFVPSVTAAVASWLSFIANVVMFLVIAYLVFTGQSALVATIDSAFAGVAKLIADILIVVGGFGIAFSMSGHFVRSISEHGKKFREAYPLIHPK